MTAQAREPRKIRRAQTRSNYWARQRAAATTPSARFEVALAHARAAMSRPEVTDRQRDRAWDEAAAALDRVTASVTPREFTREIHTANPTAADAAKAQTGVRTRAREAHTAGHGK